MKCAILHQRGGKNCSEVKHQLIYESTAAVQVADVSVLILFSKIDLCYVLHCPDLFTNCVMENNISQNLVYTQQLLHSYGYNFRAI